MKWQITKYASSFPEAAQFIRDDDITRTPLKPTQLLLRTVYCGVNASDVNFSAGRYDPTAKLPQPSGFECIATIVKCGAKVPLPYNKPGVPVLFLGIGAFATHVIAEHAQCIPLPSADPKFLGCGVVGQTAITALSAVAQVAAGQKVLITAAAGGTGQIAVQYAKSKGCHVIAVASGRRGKSQMLRQLGADRVIDYTAENVDQVLAKEYPTGVDVVFESVGGQMFKTCLKHMAPRGKLLVIGAVSVYQEGDPKSFEAWRDRVNTAYLLGKSVQVLGFFLMHYQREAAQLLPELLTLIAQDKIRVKVDVVEGLDNVPKAIDFLLSGGNVGKVVVKVQGESRL